MEIRFLVSEIYISCALRPLAAAVMHLVYRRCKPTNGAGKHAPYGRKAKRSPQTASYKQKNTVPEGTVSLF